jgi:hypothetical protein
MTPVDIFAMRSSWFMDMNVLLTMERKIVW